MNKEERSSFQTFPLQSTVRGVNICFSLFSFPEDVGSQPLKFKLKKYCLVWPECWVKLKPFPHRRCFLVGMVCVCVYADGHAWRRVCVWQGAELLPFLDAPPGASEHLQPSLFHMPRASQPLSIINSGWLWINKPPSVFPLSERHDFSSAALWRYLFRSNAI